MHFHGGVTFIDCETLNEIGKPCHAHHLQELLPSVSLASDTLLACRARYLWMMLQGQFPGRQ